LDQARVSLRRGALDRSDGTGEQLPALAGLVAPPDPLGAERLLDDVPIEHGDRRIRPLLHERKETLHDL